MLPSISTYAEGINGFTVPRDLETALQLVYGYFTEPRRDSVMFDVYKQQLTAELVNKGNDPGSVFGDSVGYIMSDYNPRSRPLSLNRIPEIDFDKAISIYKERFANAGDFLFTFVGNFSVDSMRPLLSKYIASLPAKGGVENWKDVGIRYPTGVINKVIKKLMNENGCAFDFWKFFTNDISAFLINQYFKIRFHICKNCIKIYFLNIFCTSANRRIF